MPNSTMETVHRPTQEEIMLALEAELGVDEFSEQNAADSIEADPGVTTSRGLTYVIKSEEFEAATPSSDSLNVAFNRRG